MPELNMQMKYFVNHIVRVGHTLHSKCTVIMLLLFAYTFGVYVCIQLSSYAVYLFVHVFESYQEFR